PRLFLEPCYERLEVGAIPDRIEVRFLELVGQVPAARGGIAEGGDGPVGQGGGLGGGQEQRKGTAEKGGGDNSPLILSPAPLFVPEQRKGTAEKGDGDNSPLILSPSPLFVPGRYNCSSDSVCPPGPA